MSLFILYSSKIPQILSSSAQAGTDEFGSSQEEMIRRLIMATYVKFETPQAVAENALEAIEIARTSGKIKIGVNEVTKAVERGKAKLVVMAEDIDPPELMLHIPILCAEKKIPFAYVKTKDELGKSAGLKVNTSSITIIDEGKAKKNIEDVQKEVEKLRNND
jgi:large subunit ribosomal protein L7Ae